MATYVYKCTNCLEEAEQDFPIGTARRVMRCECGETMRLVIGAGVNIAPSALENRGASVREADAREDRWNKDLPAYYRMRQRGMQPKKIDDCGLLEDRVGDQIDIDRDGVDVTRDQWISAKEEVAALTGQPVNPQRSGTTDSDGIRSWDAPDE